MNQRLSTLYFATRGYVLAALLGLLVRMRMYSAAPLHWEFLGLLIIGLVLRFWAGAYLGTHGNSMHTESPVLLREGPYRFSRNPLYIANLFVGTGLILFANCLPSWIAILLIALLIIHHSILIRWEEKNLLVNWSENYADYMHSTARWFGWKNSASSMHEENPAQWNKVWIWQGRNFVYTILSAFVLWSASRWK